MGGVYNSAGAEAILLAQQMPGLAVMTIHVRPGMSSGTKHQTLTLHDLAHRQNVPDILRDDVDRHKINFGLAVSQQPSALASTNVEVIQTLPHVGDTFYLYAPQFLPTLHDEVKWIDAAIRLGHHETEPRRLVQKGHLTKIAVLANYEPAFPCSPPGTALLGRWNASA
jgi:hypothetical protein